MFREYLLKEAEDGTKEKIIQFFSNNPKPKDSDIHAFAEKEKIDPHKFEEIIYGILGSFLGAGRSKDFKGKYDENEMKLGMKVEMEHTTDPAIAKRIAQDHLAEYEMYYTALIEMENLLKNEMEE